MTIQVGEVNSKEQMQQVVQAHVDRWWDYQVEEEGIQAGMPS
jgi:hypothetical protein